MDAKKQEILSLVGSLQHTTKVVRAFVSRMYATAAKFKKLHYHGRLNLEFRSNLCWGHTFLTQWNGLSLLHWNDQDWTPNYIIQTRCIGNMGLWFIFGQVIDSSGPGHRSGQTSTLW